MNARPGDAAVAALASVVALWPLTTLLATGEWLNPALAMVLMVAVTGVLARAARLRGWQVAVLQLLAAAVGAGWLHGRGHLWHGLPGVETVVAFNSLLVDAIQSIQTYVAPAPTTRGLSLMVGLVAGALAVAVDYLGVTRRSAPLAGLPLLAVFLGSSANSGSSLHPAFFAALALVWLVMVGRQGTALVRRWSTTTATPLTPVASVSDSGAAGAASLGRSLGVAAIAVALLVPLALPHLPTRFLLSGLGRNDSSTGNGGSVGFSQSLDLARDLADRSTEPVLTYRTSAPAPPPLRVTVSSTYVDGKWLPPRRSVERIATSPDPAVPAPTGLDPSVPKQRYLMSVQGNLLERPNLAAPYPLAGADLGGVSWGLDNRTQVAYTADQAGDYDVAFWQVEPDPATLRAALPGTDNRVVDARDLQVDPLSRDRVTALAKAVTRGRATPYDRALAIQEFLRSTGGFTYSLTLAPPVSDPSGRPDRLDPISHFLLTRQGYCVQFATAMVMMARSLGIPARMAVGFLPGHVNRGLWTVAVSDAHAWPELYLDGVGWLRFEPTPAGRSGAAPVYATVLTGAVDEQGRPTDQSTVAGGRTSSKQDLLEKSLEDAAARDAVLRRTSTSRSWVDALPRGWALVVLAALLGLAGAVSVPLGAAWSRRRRLAAAGTAAGRVEAEWLSLTERLADLGMPCPPSQTPRQLREHYVREAYLDADGARALGRVLGTLERARYAPPTATAPVADVGADARRVLKAVAPTRPRRLRVRAALWPSSGVAAVRRTRAALGRRLRTPLRATARSLARLRRD